MRFIFETPNGLKRKDLIEKITDEARKQKLKAPPKDLQKCSLDELKDALQKLKADTNNGKNPMDIEEGGTVLDRAIDIMGIMEITQIVGIMAIMEKGVEVATLLEHGPVERAKVILQARAAPAVAALLVDEVIDDYPPDKFFRYPSEGLLCYV